MSQASGQLTARSKALGKQGKIHTENPELLKLLRDNSPDIKDNKNSSKKNPSPDKSEKRAGDKNLNGKGADSKRKLIDARKKDDTDSGHFEGEDFLISDTKENLSSRDNKENQERQLKSVGLPKAVISNSMNESDKENVSEERSGKHIVSVNWDSEADNSNQPPKVPQSHNDVKTSADDVAVRKDSLEEEGRDNFILSDVNESDRETLESSSSELARLRSPSRKSLNPDFEGSPVPSSPVHPVEEGGDNPEDKRESATPVAENTRAAGATPHPSSRRPVSQTPTPTQEINSAEEEDNTADAAKPKDPYDIYKAPSHVKTAEKDNTSKAKDPYDISGAKSLTKTGDPQTTEIAAETEVKPKSKNPYDLSKSNAPADLSASEANNSSSPKKDPYSIYNTTDTNKPGGLERAGTQTLPDQPPAEAVDTDKPIPTAVTASPAPPAAVGKTPVPLTHNNPAPTYSGISPRQSKSSFRQTPSTSEPLTPRGGQALTAVNPKLLQSSIEDKSLQLESSEHPRFTASYSSNRLKPRGDAAKRSASAITLQDSLDTHREEGDTTGKSLEESASIEKDSLEVSQNIDAKDKEEVEEKKPEESQPKETKEVRIQDPAENVVVAGNLPEANDDRVKEDVQKPVDYDDNDKAGDRLTPTLPHPSQSASEIPQKQTITVDTHQPKQTLNPNQNFQRDRSYTEDNLRHARAGAPSVNQQEQLLPAPDPDFHQVIGEEEPTEHVEFVLKTDPSKQGPSRYSSAQGSGRFSTTSHRDSDAGRGMPTVAGVARRNSHTVTPSAKKVYVESPTFTKEEEEEYRFVNSRLEDVEEEKADTYRELDMAAIQNQENYAPMGAQKLAAGKRVRYSDMENRYEDRDQGMNGDRGEQGYSQAGRVIVHDNSGYLSQDSSDGAYNQPAGYMEDQRNRRDYVQQQPPPQQQQGFQPHPPHPQQQQQQMGGPNGAAGGYGQPNYGNHQAQPQNFGTQQGYAGNPPQQGTIPQNQGFGMNPQVGYHNDQNNPQQGFAGQQGFTNPQANNQQLPNTHNNPPQYLQQQPQQQPQGYSQQFQQHPVQPPPAYQNQKLQQQQPPQQPPQDNKPPVRGLSLPTGPSYDPVDEEDLQRETTYQQGLRQRIQDGNRQAQETNIPNLPLNPDQGYAGQGRQAFGSQDFAQDSLDYESNDDTARSFGNVFPQDSIEMYGRPPPRQPQNHFQNPPPLPQSFAGHNNNNQFQGNRLMNNVNFDSEDYADYEDIRHPRVNPQVQPRFYNPQLDPNNQGNLNNDGYFDSEPNTERSDGDTFRGQRYEDRNQGQYMEEEPMEAVYPQPPKYDYVNNNKEDYGKQQPRSYSKIHEITKEEKEKLNDIFIHPKPKSKQGILKKKDQGQGQSRQGSQASNFQPQPQGQFGDQQMGYDAPMTSAEQVWAQRSATLAKKVDGKRGKRVGPGGLQKFNSDSSLSQASNPPRRQGFQYAPQQQQQQHPPQQQQQQYNHQPSPQQQNQQMMQLQPQQPRQLAPDKRAFLTEMPTPVSDGGYPNQMLQQPLSPRQPEIQLQPISQQIVTEDGQRISVDVNLKLISPPPHVGGPQQQQYYPYQQQQPQHQPPQYYGGGGGGRGRQYPAVMNFDNDGNAGGYGMPALEYNNQDYEDNNDLYGSPRVQERYSADEALRALNDSRTEINPYGKIPPIVPRSRGSGSEHPSSAPIPDQGGSYMDMYIKQKEKEVQKPWYRVYGLRDYRKMQKEVRLGTLGPDLDNDATRERREKVARQTDYAKIVMEKNRNDLSHKKPPSFPRHKEENDIISKRKLAVEYSKSVPKPTVKIEPNEFNNYEMASEKSPIAKHHKKESDLPWTDNQNKKKLSPSPSQSRKKEKEMDVLDLEKLRQRYEEDKQNEAIIRRNTASAKGEKYY